MSLRADLGLIGQYKSGGDSVKDGPAMPDSSLTAHTVNVPGARLCYERRGGGRRLLLIGSPVDSAGLAGLAGTLADR